MFVRVVCLLLAWMVYTFFSRLLSCIFIGGKSNAMQREERNGCGRFLAMVVIDVYLWMFILDLL